MSSEVAPTTVTALGAPAVSTASGPRSPWLFSPGADLGAFLGSCLLSLFLLFIGYQAGLLRKETPDWTWITSVLLIDVAHVWSTAFIVYFDRKEFQRRRRLYLGVPILAFVIGVALQLQGDLIFWRVLAYLAVFHFVRQQWGWVAMYRGRLREPEGFGLWVDKAAIYLATLYPLIHWHAHLADSKFKWFRTGDFVEGRFYILDLPAIFGVLERITWPIYLLCLILYALRAIQAWREGRPNPGKDIVVATTALCWYLGIVAFNSDYAFTVTNVVIHGVPYFVLIFWYWRAKREAQGKPQWSTGRMLLVFLATLWALAYIEELFWHRGKWHERQWLFGGNWDLTWPVGNWVIDFSQVLVPLLAVPQVTHYILDGFIWKRRSNPDLALLSGRGKRS